MYSGLGASRAELLARRLVRGSPRAVVEDRGDDVERLDGFAGRASVVRRGSVDRPVVVPDRDSGRTYVGIGAGFAVAGLRPAST
jgi:hypothetical protein